MSDEGKAAKVTKIVCIGKVINTARIDGVTHFRFERSSDSRVEVEGASQERVDAISVIVSDGRLKVLRTPGSAAATIRSGTFIDHVGTMEIGPNGVFMDGVRVESDSGDVGIVVGGDMTVTGDQTFIVGGGTVQITAKGVVDRRATVVGDGKHGGCTVVVYQPTCPDLDVVGASQITLTDVDQGELELEVSGAATIIGAGVVKKLRLDISGAATIALEQLLSMHVKASVSGAANVRLTATEEIRGDVSGVARVTVHGATKRRDVETSGLANAAYVA